MSDIVLGENDPRDDIVAEADPNAPKVDPEVRKAHLRPPRAPSSGPTT